MEWGGVGDGVWVDEDDGVGEGEGDGEDVYIYDGVGGGSLYDSTGMGWICEELTTG